MLYITKWLLWPVFLQDLWAPGFPVSCFSVEQVG